MKLQNHISECIFYHIRLIYTQKTFCSDEIISTLFCCICPTPTRDHGDSCSSESKQCVGNMSTPIKETWSLVNKSNSPDRGAVGDNFGDGRCDLAPVRDSRLDVGLNRNRNNKRQPRNQRHRSNKSKQTDPRCLHTEGQGVDMPL